MRDPSDWRQDRIHLAAGLILVAGLSSLATAQTTLDPHDGAILPVAEASALLHQCSRQTPQEVKGLWLPNSKQIVELEARLPAALSKARPRRPSTGSARQYGGFVVAGHKIIYVNGFPKTEIEVKDREPFDWHHRAIVVCDGGDAFFGVEYDLQKKTFSNFAFNGAV